jgi:hypothetical protein
VFKMRQIFALIVLKVQVNEQLSDFWGL